MAGPVVIGEPCGMGRVHWGAYMSVLATVAQGTWQAAPWQRVLGAESVAGCVVGQWAGHQCALALEGRCQALQVIHPVGID